MDKVQARFNSKISVVGDCWLWQGAKQTSGFGQIWVGTGNMLAHRYSWELKNGALPDGSFLQHTCEEKTCANPEHLVVTQKARQARPVEKVTKLFWSRVEKTETCWEWTAGKLQAGYGVMRLSGGVIKAHRFSYQIHYGDIPDGLVIDHKCNNRACVNPEHLRAVTMQQNSENRLPTSSAGSTGVRGVQYEARSGKYRVNVTAKGKRYSGGTFATLEEAKTAVIALRNEVHTHNDHDRQVAA